MHFNLSRKPLLTLFFQDKIQTKLLGVLFFSIIYLHNNMMINTTVIRLKCNHPGNVSLQWNVVQNGDRGTLKKANKM